MTIRSAISNDGADPSGAGSIGPAPPALADRPPSGAETELNGRAVAAGGEEIGAGTPEATAGAGREGNGAGTVVIDGSTMDAAACTDGAVTGSIGGSPAGTLATAGCAATAGAPAVPTDWKA